MSADGDVTILTNERLDQIASRLERGETIEPVTLRELLTWFGADRRGVQVSGIIRAALEARNLRIEPDPLATSLEGEVKFRKGNSAATYSVYFLRYELTSTRLAMWIDENPNATESEIRSKATDLNKLDFGELADYENFLDDFMKIETFDENLDGYKKLKEVATILKSGGMVDAIKVREMLRWFGASRRGVHTTYLVHATLRMIDLRTEPDFNEQYIDNTIELHEGYQASEADKQFSQIMWVDFVRDRLADWIDRQHPDWSKQDPDIRRKDIQATAVAFSRMTLSDLAREPSADELDAQINQKLNMDDTNYNVRDLIIDVCNGEFVYHIIFPLPGSPWPMRAIPALPIDNATLRVSDLVSATTKPISLSPTDRVSKAIHLMELHEISWIPVISRNTVKGTVSWRSVCLWLNGGGNPADEVQKCMGIDPAPRTLRGDAPLLEMNEEIQKHQYVLIRDTHNNISGSVTTDNLCAKLQNLSEPFLLLMEIENQIRLLISHGKFGLEDLQRTADPKDQTRMVNSLCDLTFGEYLRLLDRDDAWHKLEFRVNVDKKIFNARLNEIKGLRNEIMHFRTDSAKGDIVQKLREYTKYLRKIQTIQRVLRS